MKNSRILCLLTTIVINVMVCSCSTAQTTLNDKKILIVYLSRTNNTKAVAEIIHSNVGGRIVALELQKPYPGDYRATVQQVVRENETGYLPLLKTKIDSFEKYDVIFIGFPTWDMKMPPPMKSFLHSYNFAGKTIIPFNTNAGYRVGSGFDTVRALCPQSVILEGYSTTGGIERDGVLFVIQGEKEKQVKDEISRWLQTIKLLNR